MWLRLYTDILNNSKVQQLEPAHFKGWINLLCLAAEDDQGVLPDIKTIAWFLRLTEDEASTLVDELVSRKLLDVECGMRSAELLKPHNWDKWQRPSGIFADRLLQGEWPTIRLQVLERDNWECQYCGAEATAVDHIIARSRGGTNDMENLVAACKPCNSRKRDRTPEEAGMRLMKYAVS